MTTTKEEISKLVQILKVLLFMRWCLEVHLLPARLAIAILKGPQETTKELDRIIKWIEAL